MKTPLAALVAAIFLAAPALAAAEQREIRLLSDGPFAADAELRSELAGVSDDGSRAILSTPEVLAGTDTDALNDLYEAGSLAHLTYAPNSMDPSYPVLQDLSADGTRVVFATKERLLATDTDSAADDLYLRGPGGQLTHLTDDPTGPDENTPAHFEAMSGDGARVFFVTQERLAPTDTDAEGDVYAWTPSSLLHVSDDPTGPDDEIAAVLTHASADGMAAIISTRERLAGTDTDSAIDAYRWTPAGLGHLGDDGADDELLSTVVHITADGARTWLGTKERLSPADDDGAWDFYEVTGSPTLVSDGTGADAEADVTYRGGSSAGTFAFTTAERLVASDTDAAEDVYAVTPGGVLHVSDDPTGDDDGVPAAFAGIAGNGAAVLFSTDEPLAATDTDGEGDLYLRRLGGGLAHVSDGAFGDEQADPQFAWISHDARRVVFSTKERLTAEDGDAEHDLYESGPGGMRLATPGTARAMTFEGAAPDGRLFIETTERLSAADTDSEFDVYVSVPVADPVVVPPSGGPAPAGDGTPPRISGLRVRGRTVRFRLSEPARVRLRFARGGRVRRTVAVAGRAGANRVVVRRLPAGRYRLTATLRDGAGNAGTARRLSFHLPTPKEHR